MSKFTKTVAGFAGSIALIASLAGSAGAATFSTNLKQGSKGAEVIALQTFLVSGGYLVMPAGVNMGYFGSLTKAAVIAFQTAKGITPAVGFFGPITQTAANAGGATTSSTPGCVAGAMYSSTNGALCTTTTTVAGCTAGAMYNYMTGALCSTTTTSTSGKEGSFTTRLASLPADNANIRSVSDVPVYGIEVKAIGSDISVDRVDLQFAVTPSGGSAQNPGTFITGLTFNKDGSTVLKTVALTSADFSKDSSDRYHVLVSGIGFKVPVSTTKVLTVTMNTSSISSTDSNRAITVQGYAGNANNIRGVDGAGIQSYTDMSGAATTRTHTAKAPGNATLTVTIDDALTPDASNNKVSSTNGIIKMTMLAFSAKAETGDAKLVKIYVGNNATITGGKASTLYLTDLAGNVLSSVTGPAVNTEGLLNNINTVIPQDTTSKFLIKADYPTTALGQMASTSLAVNSVQWEKPDGSTASTTPSSILASSDQYMDASVPIWTLISAPTPTVTSPAYVGAASSTITATLTFKVVAAGAALTKPVIADFGLAFASSTQTTYTTGSGGAGCNVDGSAFGAGTCGFTSVIDSITPSDATVGDGGSYLVTVKATQQVATAIGWDIVKQSANYFLTATSVKATVGTALRQTWNTTDWHTPSAYLTHT